MKLLLRRDQESSLMGKITFTRVILTRFMDQSELWKIGALGSILPIAHTRLAFY